MEGQYTLEIIDGATPVVHPPRRVPVALKGKLKKELDRLQSLGIIEQDTEPTPWVSSLVTVLKPNGQIRVCIDPKDLNRVLPDPDHRQDTSRAFKGKSVLNRRR